MAQFSVFSTNTSMADDDGAVDPTVERLRLCVEQERKIVTEEGGGGGFRLGDDDVVIPKVRCAILP